VKIRAAMTRKKALNIIPVTGTDGRGFRLVSGGTEAGRGWPYYRSYVPALAAQAGMAGFCGLSLSETSSRAEVSRYVSMIAKITRTAVEGYGWIKRNV